MPLHIAAVHAVHGNQVEVTGTAVVFGRILLAPLATDMDVRIAAAAIDSSRLLPQLRRVF